MRSRENALLRLLFPRRCAFCGKPNAQGLCSTCDAGLPRLKKPVLAGTFGTCAVPLRYEGVVREAILRFKFRGRRSAAEGFGRLLAQCVATELGGAFDRVTWVPVSEKRKGERRYDQSYLLARETARIWETELLCLLKKQHTPPQSSLGPAERRANVLGAFSVADEARVRGGRILLIDDILTTGATLSECVRVLRGAGAADVVCACLAAASTER